MSRSALFFFFFFFFFWVRGLLGIRAQTASSILGRENEADDQAVQPESLGEDEHEHHANVQLRLLSGGADAVIADDADGQAGRQPGKAACETTAEVREPLEGRVVRHVVLCGLDAVADDHGDDEPVDAKHTSHDDRDNVLHHESRVHNAHGRDPTAALCGTVSSAEVGEDKRGSRANVAEEGRVRRVLLVIELVLVQGRVALRRGGGRGGRILPAALGRGAGLRHRGRAD
mmetsp:Transcript_19926/g.47033  ORF Transcript_19926/g.47033 Transcript_19926/m.47033 type:complete len:230 (+) Transcript_19926:291-980(+)